MGGMNSMGGGNGMSGVGGMGGMGSMSGMGGMGGLGISPGGLGGMGVGVGLGGAAGGLDHALQQMARAGPPSSQLSLVMPASLIQQSLVPRGHIADVAQRCCVRVDLGEEVPPSGRVVSLTGTAASNAFAAYLLQERALQCSAVM